MARRAMMLGLDGADPYVIRRLIDAGRLPNMKKILDEGTAHFDLTMLGAFPSVTPPNWASLATGSWPRTHGVTDYFNHTLGKDLDIAEEDWDSRRTMSENIWEKFSAEGKRCIMMNYCQAWPPRLVNDDNNVFVDGTGVVPFQRCDADQQKVVTLEVGDFPIEVVLADESTVPAGDLFKDLADEELVSTDGIAEDAPLFEPLLDIPMRIVPPKDPGKPLDAIHDEIHTPLKDPENWSRELPEGALVAVVPLNNGNVRRYFVLTGDTITIYKNRKAEGEPLGCVEKGKWSGVIYDDYVVDGENVKAAYRIRWMLRGSSDTKIRLYLSHAQNMNDYGYIYPQAVGKELLAELGPCIQNAKFTYLEGDDIWEEHDMMFESFVDNVKWQVDASNWLFEKYPDWDLYYIHLHPIDLYNHFYLNKMQPGQKDWERYAEYNYKMYELNDWYVGEMMKQLDGNTDIIVVSDHAGIPHTPGDTNPCIGSIAGITTGVMEELGWTKSYQDEKGEWHIDWSQTKAVFQRSSYVYINLKGRDPHGIVEPEDYEQTVSDVISSLYNYRHPDTGKRVVAFCMDRHEMEIVGMGGPHVGDILCQLVPTYCEEHANCPTSAVNEGHSLNNLCMMIGPDFKEGELFRRFIRVTDIVPTICHLTDTPVPSNTEGGVIWQALKGFEEIQYEPAEMFERS